MKKKNSEQKYFGTITPGNRVVNNIGLNARVIKTKNTFSSYERLNPTLENKFVNVIVPS